MFFKFLATFIGNQNHFSWTGNLPFWGTLLPQKPKIGRIGERAGHVRARPAAQPDVNISVEMRRRKIHARDSLFAECRAACGRRIGMCGYYVSDD